jgi:hypothetical protein
MTLFMQSQWQMITIDLEASLLVIYTNHHFGSY